MKFIIHPLFVLYMVFLAIFGQFESLIVYMFVVIIHELAHSFVAKKLGYKLDKLILMPYGVCLNYQTKKFFPKDEFFIALAGPLINLLLCILCLALWWIFPIVMPATNIFFVCNLVLFAFNLLPCYPLDGGRILCSILTQKYDRKFAIKITVLFNILLSIILILTFFIGLFFGVINMNLLIISMFLIVSIIEPKNKSSYNYLLLNNFDNSLCVKGNQIKFILINSDEKIYKIIAKMSKNKFNIFYIIYPNKKIKMLTQFSILNFVNKYDLTTEIGEIV